MNYSADRKHCKAGPFFGGFLAGMIFCLFIVAGAGFFLLQKPELVLAKAQDLGLQTVIEKKAVTSVEKTWRSLPKEVIAEKQPVISQTFEKLTAAYASGQLDENAIRVLSSRLVNILSDHRITPQEIDSFLELADRQAN